MKCKVGLSGDGLESLVSSYEQLTTRSDVNQIRQRHLLHRMYMAFLLQHIINLLQADTGKIPSISGPIHLSSIRMAHFPWIRVKCKRGRCVSGGSMGSSHATANLGENCWTQNRII